MAATDATWAPGRVDAEGDTVATVRAPAPECFEREASERTLRISWRGTGHRICIVGGALGLALSGAAFLYLPQPVLAAAVWQAACILLAVVSAYVLLVGLLNRTVISMSPGRFTASHGPLPCVWPLPVHLRKARKLPPVDILRVWVEEEPRRPSRNSRESTYGVTVMTIGAGRLDLLTRLRLEEAQYLEREIGEYIGLED